MAAKFVTVGVTTLDIVGYPINHIPSSERGELVEKIHLCPAGTAAAAAVTAAKMGTATTLISALADDDIGAFVRHKLNHYGVDTSLISNCSDLPTATTILPINSRGERPNWHMPGAFLTMEIDSEAQQRIINADHIHWGGIGLLFNLDGAVAAKLLKQARDNGAVVTADLISPGPDTINAFNAIAPHLDYFMPSIDEAFFLSGANSVRQAGEFFLQQGVTACIIKCGGDGAYFFDNRGDCTHIPAISDVKVIDTSGCGDSFCGGFNTALAQGFAPIEAAHFATATAAQVASSMGSDGGVKDFATTLKIMRASSMNV